MYQQRIGARAEYLQEEKERVKASPTLVERFPRLKSLSAVFSYVAPGSQQPRGEIKCSYNLSHAKSLFLFDCPNKECVGGNFDLSDELARAVSEGRAELSGETHCGGWQSKTTIDRVYCGHILRYKLSLEF
jgi:hypothetical protein